MPSDLSGEQVLEWERITSELDAAGRLQTTDRALLVLWCRLWAVNSKVYAVVDEDGAIVKLPNNWPGPSAEFKAMMETTKALAVLADKLGISRGKTSAAKVESDDSDALKF